MLQYLMFVSLFITSSVSWCMEPIKPTPLTVKEIPKTTIWSWIKNLAPQQTELEGDEVTQVESCDSLCEELKGNHVYQRLAVSEQEVKNDFHEKLYTALLGTTYITSCDQPLGSDWESVKKALATCELLAAQPCKRQYWDSIKKDRKSFALKLALWHDDLALAQLLLAHEANPNYVEHDPVYFEARSVKMAKLLLDHGADYTKVPKENAWTLLHTACNGQKQAGLVAFYVAQGCLVNAHNANNNDTPLMVLARNAFYEPCEKVEQQLKALLQAGADTSVKNGKNKTVVDIAHECKVPGKTGPRYFPESVDLFIQMIQEAQEKK